MLHLKLRVLKEIAFSTEIFSHKPAAFPIARKVNTNLKVGYKRKINVKFEIFYNEFLQ